MSRTSELSVSEAVIAYKKDLHDALGNVGCADDETTTQALQSVLERWPASDGVAELDHICHVLEQDYLASELSLGGLNSQDLGQFQALQTATQGLGFFVFFALVWKARNEGDEGAYDANKRQWGSHYFDYEDTFDGYDEKIHSVSPWEGTQVRYKVKRLFDMDGNTVARTVPLHQKHWLQEPEHFGSDAEEDEDMGDTGLTARHWYRKAAVMVVPEQQVVFVLAQAYKQENLVRSRKEALIQEQVRYWSSRALEARSDLNKRYFFDAMVETCELWWDSAGKLPSSAIVSLPREATEDVCKTAVRFDRPSFFARAASRHQGRLSFDIFPWLRNELDQTYDAKVEPEWLDRLERFGSGIVAAIESYEDYGLMVNAVDCFLNSHKTDASVQTYAYWAQYLSTYVSRGFEQSSLATIHAKGVSSFVGLVECLHLDFALYFQDNILPRLEQEQAPSSFYLELLPMLQTRDVVGPLRTGGSKSLYEQVGEMFLRNALFYDISDPRGLTNFMINIIKTPAGKAADLRDLALDRLAGLDAPMVSDVQLDRVWLPILTDLADPLLSSCKETIDIRCQQFYRNFLKGYLLKFVVQSADMTRSFVRPTLTCSCTNCDGVNDFLASPELEASRFSMDEQACKHVSDSLRDLKVDCSTAVLNVGDPPDLLIKKTFLQLHEKARDFERRKQQALDTVSRIPRLAEIIGDQELKDVLSLISKRDRP
ncbi:hypothetical protein LIA77_11092 [Sarocladium implicatum]|nr:hypothetical protein LIA77_11092 [Sarocladium implicatum]